MRIKRQTAIDAINRGDAVYAGITRDATAGDNGSWIISNMRYSRIDHVEIDDHEPLTGCLDCGTLVEAVRGDHGRGLLCPDCDDTV